LLATPVSVSHKFSSNLQCTISASPLRRDGQNAYRRGAICYTWKRLFARLEQEVSSEVR
jgi:hypothetical protein